MSKIIKAKPIVFIVYLLIITGILLSGVAPVHAVVGELEVKTDTISGNVSFPKSGDASAGSPINSKNIIFTSASWNTDAPGSSSLNSFKLRNTGYSTSGAIFRFGIINQDNTEVFSIKSNGYVGIGTTNPDQLLTVAGVVESTSGGFKFPDGTTQTSAYAQTIPANMIMFSSTLSGCPAGWSTLTAANGRLFQGLPGSGTLAGTVGTALTSGSLTRTITGVPNHTHASFNLPSASTGTESVSHSHTWDPPELTTSGGSTHAHSVDAYLASGTGNTLRSGLNPTTTTGTVTTQTQYHYHNTNIAAVTSSAASATHTHTVDIASFNSGSYGPASVDVTMPYIQYLACIKG